MCVRAQRVCLRICTVVAGPAATPTPSELHRTMLQIRCSKGRRTAPIRGRCYRFVVQWGAIMASEFTEALSVPGTQEITFSMPGLSVGMACCFDLRFPVFLARYGPRVPSPVHCVCAPSAFLDITGKEHWELLLRRTALDGQCFVVAPDIAFDAQDATPLHGRSMVVDPFGRIISQCDAEGDGIALADITAERVEEVRAKLPLTLWEA